MKGLKRKAAVLTVAASLAVGSMTACGGAVPADDVVMKVNGEEVSLGVANFYARYQQAQMETSYGSMLGEDMWSQELSEGKTYEDSVKDSVIENLQMMYLLKEHAKEYNVSLTDEETKKIEETAKAFEENNTQAGKEAVSAQDTATVEEFLELLTIRQKMYDAITKDVDTNVTDEEAAQKSMQYVEFAFSTTNEDGSTKTLSDEEKTKLKETAQSFAANAKTAGDFASYASGAGYEAKTQTFDAESTTPNSEFVKAADALKEGEVTGVVESANGYYVAKVTSLLDREATDTEKESIVNQRKSDKYTEVTDGWKKDADISVDKGAWKKVDFEKQGVTVKQEDTTNQEGTTENSTTEGTDTAQ